MLEAPAPPGERVELEKGPNIVELGRFDPLPDTILGPLLIKLEDDVSTDEILPAGARALPYRSNIPEIAKFTFEPIDDGYYERAFARREGGHFVLAGRNYGQGSSREHAALACRYLGVRAVIAASFARIHWENLTNFGIVPFELEDPADGQWIEPGDELEIRNVARALQQGGPVEALDRTQNRPLRLRHRMTRRQVEMVLAGGIIALERREVGISPAGAT
jgi:aconitate hydratase